MKTLTHEEQVVEEAAQLLDQRYPSDWPDRINLDNFSIKEPSCCVLYYLEGTLDPSSEFGRYERGIERLGLDYNIDSDWIDVFADDRYTPVWAAYIQNRRGY